MDRPLTRHRLGHRRRGDAIVEFALLAPILVMILFGIMEFGRVLDVWLVVHNAAREGARAGAAAYLGQDPATLAQSAANDYLNSSLADRTDVVRPFTVLVPPPTSGDVTVKADVKVQMYTPMFQALVGPMVDVGAAVDMRRQ